MSLLLHIDYIVRSQICFVLNDEYILRNTKQLKESQIEIYNITNLELKLAILYDFITLPLGYLRLRLVEACTHSQFRESRFFVYHDTSVVK